MRCFINTPLMRGKYRAGFRGVGSVGAGSKPAPTQSPPKKNIWRQTCGFIMNI